MSGFNFLAETTEHRRWQQLLEMCIKNVHKPNSIHKTRVKILTQRKYRGWIQSLLNQCGVISGYLRVFGSPLFRLKQIVHSN